MRACGELLEVAGVEWFGKSVDYAWEHSDGKDKLPLRTLFPQGARDSTPSKAFEKHLDEELSEISPEVVALPGWSQTASFLTMRWCIRNWIPFILMSESSAHDEERSSLREFIKHRIVSWGSAGLVGGRLHADYLEQLGMLSRSIAL